MYCERDEARGFLFLTEYADAWLVTKRKHKWKKYFFLHTHIHTRQNIVGFSYVVRIRQHKFYHGTFMIVLALRTLAFGASSGVENALFGYPELFLKTRILHSFSCSKSSL